MRHRALLLGLWLAAPASAAPPPPAPPPPAPGLQLPSPDVLPYQAQTLTLQAIFQGNYPLTAVGFGEGMPGGFEFGALGLFHHDRIEGFHEWRKYDYDEYGGTLRWGPAAPLPAGGAFATGAGFARQMARQVYSDGRYSLYVRRYWWGEATAAVGTPGGLRLVTGTRWLREVETGRDVGAALAGVEVPGTGSLTLVADSALFLRNPGDWSRPWAAGLRTEIGTHRVYAYASNTWGPLPVDALFGTSTTFWNLRVVFGM